MSNICPETCDLYRSCEFNRELAQRRIKDNRSEIAHRKTFLRDSKLLQQASDAIYLNQLDKGTADADTDRGYSDGQAMLHAGEAMAQNNIKTYEWEIARAMYRLSVFNDFLAAPCDRHRPLKGFLAKTGLVTKCDSQAPAAVRAAIEAFSQTDQTFAANHQAGMPMHENVTRKNAGEYGP